jgi:hypothetical protein
MDEVLANVKKQVFNIHVKNHILKMRISKQNIEQSCKVDLIMKEKVKTLWLHQIQKMKFWLRIKTMKTFKR